MGSGRYTAFLSYSHRDAADARWLHRRLEAYRIPRRLVGSEGARGAVPARLAPIFRDREELPAAGDLSEQVRAALARSETLIVLCSADSAASPWVAKEVAAFRELHPDRPILAAIVAGDPPHCFPRGLADGGVEPLAADLRPGADGRRLGFLKLVAGLAGVGVDALVQRDAQRRIRRVTAVTAAALAAMLVMAVMTTMALTARAEAQRQRAEAEGLVEFMLTDLRDRLKAVGRLDVLSGASHRALEYYARQDLSRVPPASLARRARVLQARGEDEQERGDSAAARDNFQEAHRTTAALFAKQPNDPDIIFSHAQSEFWIGTLAWQREDYQAAEPAFRRYAALADRLSIVAPNDPRSLEEVGYARGNLCALKKERGETAGLVDTCMRALRAMQAVAARSPGDAKALRNVAHRHAWLADAYRATGSLKQAMEERRREGAILNHLLAEDSKDARLHRALIWSERALASLEHESGQSARAAVRLRRSIGALESLISRDPDNAELAEELGDMKRKLHNITATGEKS